MDATTDAILEATLDRAAELIRGAKNILAFTGAGASVESGIPAFRGSADSLWSKCDPNIIELNYFHAHPKESWKFIRDVFMVYMFRTDIKPNASHKFLADLEKAGKLKWIVTQNIDNLHQVAGSKEVYEFHGTAASVTCEKCDYSVRPQDMDLTKLPPRCPKCGGLLKPDFVFFGEGIPEEAYEKSFAAAEECDLCIVIGTSGIVMPADMIPAVAKRHGATVIEFNTEESEVTRRGITDILVKGPAGKNCAKLSKLVF